MKKLLIALAAFLLVIAASVVEIVYSTRSYSLLEQMGGDCLKSIEVCVDYKQALEKELSSSGSQDPDTLARAQSVYSSAKEKIERLKNEWEKKKCFAGFFGNHSIVKSVDERVTTLSTQADNGSWEDAGVSAAALTTYFKGLKDDTHPSPSNLI